MERLRLEQLTSLQRVIAAMLGLPPTEVDVEQDLVHETITATVYGKKYEAKCAGDSAEKAIRDFLVQVVDKL